MEIGGNQLKMATVTRWSNMMEIGGNMVEIGGNLLNTATVTRWSIIVEIGGNRWKSTQ